ncbi:MAG: hypothetical protein AAF282_19260 [Cyanobacteria bacterium P01_A01_bin.15]
MTQGLFPRPHLTPLTRLHVHDNLRVNAERWALAHQYHRHRQNIHYQSLWQPGIVYGLGVKQIPAPKSAALPFRDRYWVEVQPGVAIDTEGNPIVVSPEDDRTYHLVIANTRKTPQTLYLVLRYVDPDGLEVSTDTDRLLERFRFDQRLNAMEPTDIELCRIRLSQTDGSLQMPADPLLPEAHQLDLRHRPRLQPRPHKQLQLGLLAQIPPPTLHQLTALVGALPGLYPQLSAQIEPSPLPPSAWDSVDVIYSQADPLMRRLATDDTTREHLENYLRAGGNLLVEAATLSPDLQTALAGLKRNLSLQPVPELHPVRGEPFLFDTWPAQPPVDLLQDGGIWVMVGPMVAAWGGVGLQRHEIRTWHEWGINLLHHWWRQRSLRSLVR